MTRRGFALLAVLWVVVALGGLTAAAVARARADATATGESVVRMRARWAAEGCLAVAQARLDSAIRTQRKLAPPDLDTLWFANGAHCAVAVLDPSTRVRRDSAGRGAMSRLAAALRALGDTTAAARETLLTRHGDGRINLNAAPPAVLATLPGFSPEALRVIADARTWHRPLRDLDDLLSRLTPGARSALLEQYAELVTSVTFQTSSLVVTARGWTDGQRSVATIELVIVSGGQRGAIVQRRMR